MRSAAHRPGGPSPILLAAMTALVLAGAAAAQTTAFTYQGKLTVSGQPAGGSYDLQFALFDALVDGTQQGATLTRNPVPVEAGVFSVALDFGVEVFDGGPRFLAIGVRPVGSSDPYAVLVPRQEVTSTPYAIQSLNAARLGGLPASDYVTSADVGGTFVRNGTDLQTAAFNIDGDGYIGGNAGIGTTSPQAKLHVAGDLRAVPHAAGDIVLGTPNAETGITLRSLATSPSPRADLRFDGNSVKLVAHPNGGVPPAGFGLAVSTNGNVGIGTTTPLSKLEVRGALTASLSSSNDIVVATTGSVNSWANLSMQTIAQKWTLGTSRNFNGDQFYLQDATWGQQRMTIQPDGGSILFPLGRVGLGNGSPAHRLSIGDGPAWTSDLWKGAVELTNGSAIGWQSNIWVNRFGIGQSNGGLYFFRTQSDPGTTAQPASYDMVITNSGNVTQPLDHGGLVKGMVRVDPFLPQPQYVVQCFWAATNASSGNCGINVQRPGTGWYEVTFPSSVETRFLAVTAVSPRVVCTATPGGSAVVFCHDTATDLSRDTQFFVIVF